MTTQMSPLSEERKRHEKAWIVWSGATIGAALLLGVTLGLIVIPSGGQAGFDAFSAICRALGIAGYDKPEPAPKTVAGAPASKVTWSAATRVMLAGGNPARGSAVVTDTCGACHGEKGISADPTQFPNLAGQSAEAIYKELLDFQSGARKSDIMGPMAQTLKPEQINDVSAYYSAQAAPAAAASGGPDIIRLVQQGDPSRAIPACEACHGASRTGPEETPVLAGQSAPYLELQLQNFAHGARSNDSFERMRTIAAALTANERSAVAAYYGGAPAKH